MVSVMKEELRGGSLVPGSEVGWRWVREVERATGCGGWRREGGDADYMCKE